MKAKVSSSAGSFPRTMMIPLWCDGHKSGAVCYFFAHSDNGWEFDVAGEDGTLPQSDVYSFQTHYVKCARCGRTHTLLLRFLGVERNQTKTAELERQGIEQAAADSYRRAARTLGQATGTRLPASTLHGWILDTQADQIDLPPDALGALPATVFADGTRYKGAGGTRGDLKALIGLTAAREIVPLGTWTRGESWRQIDEELKRRALQTPAGTVLVADAEPGLAEALADHAESYQRCQWHTVRDLYHAMWRDGGGRGESRPVQNALVAS